MTSWERWACSQGLARYNIACIAVHEYHVEGNYVSIMCLLKLFVYCVMDFCKERCYYVTVYSGVPSHRNHAITQTVRGILLHPWEKQK